MQRFQQVITGARTVWDTLSFLQRHPLSSRAPRAAMARWLRWQVGSRLLPGEAVVPFVAGAKLVMRPGMTGATGNYYAGLHEFEDMAFVLHLLRPEDRFADIGANVGSYTVLASAVCGARTVSVEPVPATYADLVQNVRVNRLEERVEALNVGVGAQEGRVRFTTSLDAINHVLADGEHYAGPVAEVPLRTLDAIVQGAVPLACKIDVEGFESAVLAGAVRTLQDPMLRAVIMELNDSSANYGWSNQASYETMRRAGFRAYRYLPFARRLEPMAETGPLPGNTLFVRDEAFVEARLRSAPAFRAAGVEV
jgi:FkbM family methyltransferase